VRVLLIIFILLALLTAVLAAIVSYAGRPGPDPKDYGFFREQRYGKAVTSLNIATAVFVAVSGFLAVTA
jgi:hypothetical protein